MSTSSEVVPTPSRDAKNNPRRSLKIVADVFAIVFASLPLLLRVLMDTFDRFTGGQSWVFMDQNHLVVCAAICLASVVGLWLASLVINIIGVIRLRILSIVGLLLNIASFVAMA